MPSPAVPNFEEMLRQAQKQPASRENPPQKSANGGSESTALFTRLVLLITLAAALFTVYSRWEPNRWLHGDGAFYLNTVRSVLEHGTLRQEAMHPHSWYESNVAGNRDVDAAWSNIAIGRNGEWWPKHPILMPLTALPFVWAFGPLGTLIFQILCVLLIGLFTWRIARRFAPRPAAMAATLIFTASSWMAGVVWGFNNDAFLTALVLGAVDAAFSLKPVPAGVLMGFAIFAKPTNVLYAPALLMVFLLRKEWRQALKFCLAAAVPCLIFAASNAWLYGAPWKTGYDNILVRIDGKLSTRSHRDDFVFTLKGLQAGLLNVIDGRQNGFTRVFPFFFLGILGFIPMLAKRTKEGLLFLWMVAVPILFHAPFHWYRADFSLPAAGLAMTPLAMLLSLGKEPFEEPFQGQRINWTRLAPFLAVVVLLVSGGIRRLAEDRGGTLYQSIKTATVTHGRHPCDYFNNLMERWECFGIRGDWEMAGRALSGLSYGGKKEKLLLASPGADGSPKVLTFPKVELGKSLAFRAGLADGARRGSAAALQISVGGEVVQTRKFSKAGQLEKFSVDTSKWRGQSKDVTLRITSDGRKFSSGELKLGLDADVIGK